MKTYQKIKSGLKTMAFAGIVGLALSYINPSYAQGNKLQGQVNQEIVKEKSKVAVLDFRYNGEYNLNPGHMFLTGLAKADCISIYERSDLKKILNEMKVNKSGVIDQQTAIEVGKLAGVDKIILGNYESIENQTRIDVRYIDVKTGKIEYTDNVLGDEKDLSLIDKLSNKLRREVCGESVQEKPKFKGKGDGSSNLFGVNPSCTPTPELVFDFAGPKDVNLTGFDNSSSEKKKKTWEDFLIMFEKNSQEMFGRSYEDLHEDCKSYVKYRRGTPPDAWPIAGDLGGPTLSLHYDLENMVWQEKTDNGAVIGTRNDCWTLDFVKGWIKFRRQNYPNKYLKGGQGVHWDYDCTRRGFVGTKKIEANSTELISIENTDEVLFEPAEYKYDPKARRWIDVETGIEHGGPGPVMSKFKDL